METTYRTIVGDRARPIFQVLKTAEGTPVDLSSSTVTLTVKTADATGTTKVAAQSATVQPTQTFTADATTNLITANYHKAANGDQVVVSTTGTLPTGLAASTPYFVIEKGPNTFKLATTYDGAEIDITGAGSGTHSFYIVGSVQYSMAAADVDTAGYYSGKWQETVGGLVRTYPASSDGIHRGFPIEINAL